MNAKSKRIRTAVLVLVASVLLALTVLFLTLQHRTNSSRRSSCIGRLYQLGMGLRMYAEEHDGRFPSHWSLITNEVNNEPRLFVNPCCRTGPGSLSQVDNWCGYVLVADRRITDPPDEEVAHGRCPGKCRSVLFVDGRVEWREK